MKKVLAPDIFSTAAHRPSTLIELLRWRSQDGYERSGYSFLNAHDGADHTLTYRELDARARSIAANLQTSGSSGQTVLLLYPPGLDFIEGFFGCLYAGKVSVPAYPPDPARLNRSLPRLHAVITDAQVGTVLTTSTVLGMVKAQFADKLAFESLNWIATDEITHAHAHLWREPDLSRDSLAFLQYTSGSTGKPKGVMLTHANLLHNAQMVYQGFGQIPQDVYVSWLPTFHDMGFMAGVLQPLNAGIPVVLMSPLSFLQSPFRWLDAISRFKGTISGGPNFGYDLCVRKITNEQRAELDLSSWALAFNGAEPVRKKTLDDFASAFEPCGFRPEAFYPCYGLAEATLIVSGGGRREPPKTTSVKQSLLERGVVEIAGEDDLEGRAVVGCGKALHGGQVRIVDPEAMKECDPGRVGEIWLSSQSVARGYWNRPEESATVFDARLAGSGEGPFLRTGDLGFIHEGELYIAGRIKDLIIIRGRNHYPQDIELTVEQCHRALRPGGGAAFSVDALGEERLVVVSEADIRQPVDQGTLVNSVREAVNAEHELQLYEFVLIRPGTIPKTSSGKIQRQACRKMFLEGTLETVASWKADLIYPADDQPVAAPRQDLESIRSWLVSQVAAKAGLEKEAIEIDQPLVRYGLDSLAAVELEYSVEETLNAHLPPGILLRGATVAELAATIHKQAKADVDRDQHATAAVHPEQEYALSQGQRALWFLYKLSPQSAAYNIARAIRVRSPLDTPAMRRALQAVLDRHPCLRSTFHVTHGKPTQRLNENVEVCFAVHDVSTWDEERLNRALIAEAHRPFNLELGPLMRVSLFTRSDSDHVMLMAFHHIAVDFWSLEIVMRELGVLYEAEASGSRPDLCPVTARYSDFVRWQAEALAGEEGERLWQYWENKLARELQLLDLPTDRPRPAVQSFKGRSRAIAFDSALTSELKALCRRSGVTLYTLLVAAFQTLLFRYTSQEDFAIGSVVAGRNKSQWSSVVGYFVNPVVLRAGLSPDLTFEQLIEQTRSVMLEAFEHQDYPFPLLVERLHPARDLSRSPLLQVMFVWQNAHLLRDEGFSAFAINGSSAPMELGGLKLESVDLEQQVSQFDLTLEMAEAHGKMIGALTYDTELFDEATVERAAGHFRVLLQAIAANPTERLSKLPLISEAESRQLLEGWNDTYADRATGVCIHHLIEAAASDTEKTALEHRGTSLSYGDLNRRANQLAHRLAALGVRPETRVGICLNRNADLVIALLAVLKAGAAYVPLDPVYPRERLSYMLGDADVRVLIVHEDLKGVLPLCGAHVVCIDGERESLTTLSEDNPQVEVSDRNLAYVIYTSGSTGRPKGVAIEHRSAVGLIEWAKKHFTRDDLRGALASTSICFDLSVFEIFLPLTCGGKIVLVQNALELAEIPDASGVTLVNTVPSAMAELVRSDRVPDSVRTVNLAGEALKAALVRQIYASDTVERVFNLYGPSEDTTYSTFALIKRGAAEAPAIGRPIDNTRIYILDPRQQIVPIGVLGEIYIGGDGLARGYLGKPYLTAERFVPDPFSRDCGGRLYRTGDLGRYRADGEIEFLGRLDHQLKIRGYRIELGEIESVLLGHPQVRASVVAAYPVGAEEKALVAYVAANANSDITPQRLQEYLRIRLPDYMVPSRFMLLEALPMTPNGKIDRKALPAPADIRAGSAADYVPPKNAIEEVLAGIWENLLGCDSVGVYDNFFELGGHSILATQVMHRVSDILQLDLPLRTFLESPTITHLAEQIEAAGMARGLDADKIAQLWIQVEQMSELDVERAYNKGA